MSKESINLRINNPFAKYKTRTWKLMLLIAAVCIGIFSLWFTNHLVDQLNEKESKEVGRIAKAFEDINKPLEDYSQVLTTIKEATIPIIVVNERGVIDYVNNLDSNKVSDTVWLRNNIRWMKFYNDPIPIKISEKVYHTIYYQEQPAITLLRYFPWVQLAIISLFLIISYVAYSASNRFEQNKVWVGMAKETAHQIGTPLSSLIAWVEYLRLTGEPPSEEILSEISKDINRLEIITERFSKIGSQAELTPYSLVAVVDEVVNYMKIRLPDRVIIETIILAHRDAKVMLNKNLFSWVIECLMKNAVDAMAGIGDIKITVDKIGNKHVIDVKDSGKGLNRNQFKLIFKPGFTTKKRGWGLGLSLSKRIITDYHKGSIFVKESEPNVGTTFRILLPIVN